VTVDAHVPTLPHVALFWENSIPLGGYYFQHRTKGPAMYITVLSPGKWDHWRDDWLIMQAEVHDRLEMPTVVPTGSRNRWEKVPDL
jgi:hypothetical protein